MGVRVGRTGAVLALIVAVGGCASTRQALGLYKRTADQGVTVGGGGGEQGYASAGSAGSETTPAAPRAKRDRSKEPKQNLPTGLAGDKEHRAYTTDAPR